GLIEFCRCWAFQRFDRFGGCRRGGHGEHFWFRFRLWLGKLNDRLSWRRRRFDDLLCLPRLMDRRRLRWRNKWRRLRFDRRFVLDERWLANTGRQRSRRQRGGW